jgi:hypothetical protein
MKRFSVSQSTLQTFVTTGFILIGVGVISILFGVMMLTGVGASGGGYSATARANSQMSMVALSAIGIGIASAIGARTPFQRAAQARNQYIDVGDDHLIVHEGGQSTRIDYLQIVDLCETDTTLCVGVRGKKSVTLTNEYENYPELVALIRSKARC